MKSDNIEIDKMEYIDKHDSMIVDIVNSPRITDRNLVCTVYLQNKYRMDIPNNLLSHFLADNFGQICSDRNNTESKVEKVQFDSLDYSSEYLKKRLNEMRENV